MRSKVILFFVFIHAVALFGYSDFARIFSFDSVDPYGFICPVQGDGSFYYKEGAALVESPLMPYAEGWKQGDLPQPGYVGFRMSELPFVNPVFSPSEPALADYTPLETDPAGDHSIPQAFLDITDTRVSFDSERIYFALRTASESYPVMSGFTFYAYMPVLVNPFVDPETDPTVYGLMYTVNVGMAISPGLYKIAGISLDGLTRIGDIEYSEQDGWLLLSCALDDLLADADVAEWLDSDYPMFATVSTTSQITLTTGIQEADYTTGGAILLKAHEVRGINQFSPVLQDLSYDISLDGTHLNNLSITYLDQDDNAPRDAYLAVDGELYADLGLLTLDSPVFSEGAVFGLSSLDLPPVWEHLQIVFSDADQTVQEIIDFPVSIQDELQAPAANIALYPNPAGSSIKMSYDMPREMVTGIYNIRGQLVRKLDLSAGKQEQSVDLSDFPAGLYLLSGDGISPRRFIKY